MQFQCNDWKMWTQRVVVVLLAPPLAIVAGSIALPVFSTVWVYRKVARTCRAVRLRLTEGSRRRRRAAEVCRLSDSRDNARHWLACQSLDRSLQPTL